MVAYKYKVGQLVCYDINYNDIGVVENQEWLHKSKAAENQYKVYWFSDGECSVISEDDLNEVQT
jgi:hypothetical protein